MAKQLLITKDSSTQHFEWYNMLASLVKWKITKTHNGIHSKFPVAQATMAKILGYDIADIHLVASTLSEQAPTFCWTTGLLRPWRHTLYMLLYNMKWMDGEAAP